MLLQSTHEGAAMLSSTWLCCMPVLQACITVLMQQIHACISPSVVEFPEAVHGPADVLPVYHLGNSQQLSFRGWPWLSRRCRVMLGVMWGVWGLPIPRQAELITLVGEPILGAQRGIWHPDGGPISMHA